MQSSQFNFDTMERANGQGQPSPSNDTEKCDTIVDKVGHEMPSDVIRDVNETILGESSGVRSGKNDDVAETIKVSGSRRSVGVQVSVTDPIKHVSDHPYVPGLTSSHYEYLVTSVFSESALSSEYTQVEVRRRFSDFVALADLLAENQRGYFIFPRPEKGTFDAATTGRSENEFIEFRRADLERYLTKLCEHPVIGIGEELKVFLTTQEKLGTSFEWQQLQPLKANILEGIARLPGQLIGSESSIPNVSDVAKNAWNTNDMLRILKEMGGKMRQDVSGASLTYPDEESRLREIRAGVERYSEGLMELSRRCEKMISESERLASITGDVGLSLIRLAKYEDEYGGPTGQYSAFTSTTQKMASDSRRIGMAAVKMSRQERNATETTIASLGPINNQLAMVQAAIIAFKEREWAFLTVSNIQEDLTKAQASLLHLEQVNSANTLTDLGAVKKIEHLKNEIASLEAALRAAEVGYEEIKRRNLVDYQRWKEQKARDFCVVLDAVAHTRQTFGQAASEDWHTVAADLRHEHSGHIH